MIGRKKDGKNIGSWKEFSEEGKLLKEIKY